MTTFPVNLAETLELFFGWEPVGPKKIAPCLSDNDVGYDVVTESEPLGYISHGHAGHSESENLLGLLLADFAGVVLLSLGNYLWRFLPSTAFHCIDDIVSVCADPQMSGIDAWRVVTRMKGVHPLRNFMSKLQFQRESVRANHLGVNAEITVAVSPLPALPFPAIIRPLAINKGVEFINDLLRVFHVESGISFIAGRQA